MTSGQSAAAFTRSRSRIGACDGAKQARSQLFAFVTEAHRELSIQNFCVARRSYLQAQPDPAPLDGGINVGPAANLVTLTQIKTSTH